MYFKFQNFLFFVIFCLISEFVFPDTPEFLWLQKADGEYNQYSNSISSDNLNNSIICGRFYGNIHIGDTTLYEPGIYTFDAFIAKYNSMGEFQWARQISGTSYQSAYRVKTDGNGDIFVIGIFKGSTSFGDTVIEGSSKYNSFISKYSASGKQLWTRSDSSLSDCFAYGLTIDKFGDCIVAVEFNDTTYIDNIQLTHEGQSDFYIAKYNGKDGSLEWVSQYGGINDENISGISLDNEENIIATGSFADECNFGEYYLTSKGEQDIFILKLDKNKTVQWAKQAGGEEQDYVGNITCDSLDNYIITGSIKDTAYFDTSKIISSGDKDIFIAKYDNYGNLLWVNSAGGESEDQGNDVAILKDNSIIITGSFQSDAHFNSTLLSSSGDDDIFWAKYNDNGELQWAKKAGGDYEDQGRGVAIDKNSYCLNTGHFYMVAAFDEDTLESLQGKGVFITKLDLQTTSLTDNDIFLPKVCKLLGNYPNPFNPSTSIVFQLEENINLNIAIHDITGKVVRKFSRKKYPIGRHSILWDGKNNFGQFVSSGIYFFTLINEKFILSTKMLLVR